MRSSRNYRRAIQLTPVCKEEQFPVPPAGVSILPSFFYTRTVIASASQEFYLVEIVLRVCAGWGRTGVKAAPPSAERRGLTLAGGSRSSRPLVKMLGGCIRREWGRRQVVSLYWASKSAKVNSNYQVHMPCVTSFRKMDIPEYKQIKKQTFQMSMWEMIVGLTQIHHSQQL